MPTVAHVKWPVMNMDYGFMYKIVSLTELYRYWLDCRTNHIQEGFRDYLKSREFGKLCGRSNTNNHVATGEGGMLAMLMKVEVEHNRPRSVADVLVDTQDRVFRGMQDAIMQHGAIYINGNGGYMPLVKGMEEVEARDVSKFVLPGASIKVSKWPGGKHFYASVGGESVTWDGEIKWNSKWEAQSAAKKWAKKNNIRVEEED